MTNETVVWRPAARIAFRFAFCYIAIYATYIVDAIVRGFGFLSFGADLTPFPANALHSIVPWFAKHVLFLQKDVVIFSNGSGDTTYDWALIALNVFAAVAATIAWSILDRKRTSYVRLYAWLRFSAAILLSAELLFYGIDKVIPAQFGAMTVGKLVTPLGSLTKMEVLWDFMAASTGYTIFTGSIEIAAASLLLVPRLRTLGAIVAAIAVTNVFALNVFYDVPVKLLSFHLLLLALLVLAPEFPRFANLLVLQRASGPPPRYALSGNPKVDRAIVLASWIVIAAFAASTFVATLSAYRQRMAALDPTTPFYGVWKVDDFAASDRGRSLDYPSRLERFVFETSHDAAVEAGGVMWRRTWWVNQKTHEIALDQSFGDLWSSRFTYKRISPDALAIQGRDNGTPFRAVLRREDTSHMELVSGGINLISEYPH